LAVNTGKQLAVDAFENAVERMFDYGMNLGM
jgi:hypothetical protein